MNKTKLPKIITAIKELPQKPGVYIFRDLNEKIIYIGKALSLKHRVSSYFQQKHTDSKTIELVKNIADLESIIVNSEFEALLLEARLIKQHEPKYNIIQKDNKSYLYIVIGKQFPNRVFTARWTELNQPLDSWYGPFPSSTDAKQVLKFIRRIFPFCSCKKLPKHLCLYKDLRLCTGVCQDDRNQDISEQSGEQDNKMTVSNEQSEYRKAIQRIKLILSGKINTLLKSLMKEMNLASKNLDYENAQVIKNQIDSLRSLTEGWRSVPKEKRDVSKTILSLRKMLVKYQSFDPITLSRIEGYDVSNLGRDIIVGSMVTFIDGEPENSLYRKFNLKYNLSGPDDPEGIKQIVRRRLNHPEWIYPQLILIDGGKTQISAAFESLKAAKLVGQISLLGITKEFETIILPRIEKEKIVSWKLLRLARANPELQLLQNVRDESHRFAQKYYQKKYKNQLLTGKA